MGEYSRLRIFDPFMDIESVEADAIHIMGQEVMREAIVNWMMEMIPELGGGD